LSDYEYEELLERARSQIPPDVFEKKHERLSISRPESRIQGSRTVLYNIKEISDQLNRDTDHLLKFLSKEMATASSMEGNYALFQGTFRNSVFRNLLDRYVQDYVTCPVCGGIDTKI